MAAEAAGFASFEEKWLQAHPEQAVVAVFLAPDERRRAHAFGSLVHEFELAAFELREPQASAAKLGWWAQEMSAAAAGHARHPIAIELLEADPALATDANWPAAIGGALAMIEAPPPASLDAAYAQAAAFAAPVAALGARAHGIADAGPAARDLWTSSRLLRSLVQIERAPQRAVVPLDLLARHGIARSALERAGAERAALLRDLLEAIGARIDAALRAGGGTIGARVRGRLEHELAARAARATDPAAALALAAPPRWRTAWLAWREARAAQRARSGAAP